MLKLVVILGGVAITALVAADAASDLVSVVIGLAIAAAGALDDYFKLGTAAERAKKLAATLEREAWSYVNFGDFYAGGRSHAEMFDGFRRRVEAVLDPDAAERFGPSPSA